MNQLKICGYRSMTASGLFRSLSSATEVSKKGGKGVDPQSSNNLKLNLPQPGDFQLSMKNICETEERIKRVRMIFSFYFLNMYWI